METYIKLNSQVAGKDKIARLLQYASRALWNFLQDKELSPLSVDKLKTVEYNFSLFRKLLRFGKSFEVLYATLKTIHLSDATLRYSLTLSKISSALFLLSDHILWIGRSGIAAVNSNKWADLSNRYWLYSIIMNLVRDFYELRLILQQQHFNRICSAQTLTKEVATFSRSLIHRHPDVFWDTLKNTCDVWIPLTALGYTKLKPGTIGVLGTISSIAGIVSLISPTAKLVPS